MNLHRRVMCGLLWLIAATGVAAGVAVPVLISGAMLALIPDVGYCAEYPLTDTGQDKCYDNSKVIPCPAPGQSFYGQDAQYRWLQPSFQDTGERTVIDKNTGLMWQKSDGQNNSLRSWSAAGQYCTSLQLAGHTDWLLPTLEELAGLVDYGKVHPAIDTRYFPGCMTQLWYWSSSSYVGGSTRAWGMLFSSGYVDWYGKTEASYVRCVRGGP